VLPFKHDLTKREKRIIAGEVIRFVKGWILCDQRCRENYREQQKKEKRFIEQAGFWADREEELFENGTLTKSESEKINKFWKTLNREMKRLRGMRPESQFSPFSPQHLPVYLLGDNYVPFALELRNENELWLEVQNHPQGAGWRNGWLQVDFGNGNGLLRNLAVTRTVVKKRKDPTQDAKVTVYTLSFDENGKRHREFQVREPRLQFVGTKQNWGLYLHVPGRFPSNPYLSRLFCFDNPKFQTHYPKVLPELDSLSPFRVLAIDLGVVRPYAWVVMEVSGYKDGLPIDIKIVAEGALTQSGAVKPIVDLKKKFERLSDLMNKTKKFAKNGENPITLSDVLPFTSNLAEYLENLRSLPANQEKWNKRGVWLCRNYLGGLIAEYKKLVNQRRYIRQSPNLADELMWVELKDLLMRVRNQFHFVGKPPVPFGSRRDADNNFCSRFHEGRQNSRENLRKGLVRQIVELAKKHESAAVVVEDLERNQIFDRKKNRLWALWSPQAMLNNLREVAKAEGIGVVKVEAYLTSHHVYGENTFGWRPDNDKRNLYYFKNGKLKSVDADINAAKNVGHLALTRHSQPFYVDFYDLEQNGEWVPCRKEKVSKDDKEKEVMVESQPMEQILHNLFGDKWREFAKADGALFDAEDENRDDFDEDTTKQNQGKKKKRLYRVGDRLVTYEERKAGDEAIKRAIEEKETGKVGKNLSIISETVKPKMEVSDIVLVGSETSGVTHR
jgi:IS605 OrfB family transposase